MLVFICYELNFLFKLPHKKPFNREMKTFRCECKLKCCEILNLLGGERIKGKIGG